MKTEFEVLQFLCIMLSMTLSIISIIYFLVYLITFNSIIPPFKKGTVAFIKRNYTGIGKDNVGFKYEIMVKVSEQNRVGEHSIIRILDILTNEVNIASVINVEGEEFSVLTSELKWSLLPVKPTKSKLLQSFKKSSKNQLNYDEIFDNFKSEINKNKPTLKNKRDVIKDTFFYLVKNHNLDLETQIKLCDVWISTCEEEEEYEMASELQKILDELKNQ